MMNDTKLSVDINNGQCDVYLYGKTDNLITAICAAIRGLSVNISETPNYEEYLKNSDMNKVELLDCISSMILSKLVNCLALFSANEDSETDIDSDETETDIDVTDKDIQVDIHDLSEISTANQLDFSKFENLINMEDK